MTLTLRDHGIIMDPDSCDRMDLKGSYRHALPIILAVEWRYEDQTTYRRGFIRLYDDWLTLTSSDDGPSPLRILPM